MSVTDGLIEEELHKILENGEAVASGWSDDEIIAEASRRAYGRAGLMIAHAPDAAAIHHWEAMIAEIRADTGEQKTAPARVEDDTRTQLVP